MALAPTDYEIEFLFVLILTIWATDYAWDHLPFTVGLEVGYATILTWIRATGWMFLSAFLWFYFGEFSVAFNTAVDSFGSPPYLSILGLWPWLCFGLFIFELVVGIVITLYLVLPTERLPKSFQYFGKKMQQDIKYPWSGQFLKEDED